MSETLKCTTSRTRLTSLDEARHGLLNDAKNGGREIAINKTVSSNWMLVLSIFLGVTIPSASLFCHAEKYRAAHLGDNVIDFQHNNILAQAPSPENEDAWRTILPSTHRLVVTGRCTQD